MTYKQPKTDWLKTDSIKNTDLNRIESNLLDLNSVTSITGTSNRIVTEPLNLYDGYKITFVAKFNNNAESTYINNIPLYYPNTAGAPLIMAGHAYEIWYDANNNCFYDIPIAFGNAQASQILQGYSASSRMESEIKGTIPIINPDASNHKTTTDFRTADSPNGTYVSYALPDKSAIHGIDWFRTEQSDLLPNNIVSGINIAGIIGTRNIPNLIVNPVRADQIGTHTFYYTSKRDRVYSDSMRSCTIQTGFQPQGWIQIMQSLYADKYFTMMYWQSEFPQFFWDYYPYELGQDEEPISYYWRKMHTYEGQYECNSTRLIIPLESTTSIIIVW